MAQTLEERVGFLEAQFRKMEGIVYGLQGRESKNSSFKKPTVAEIMEYAKMIRFYELDAQRFYDHYESNGWHVGKNKMKDWKACVRTWFKTQQERTKGQEVYKPVTIEQVTPRSKQEAEFLGREWNGN